MPKFFFDCCDGERHLIDEHGLDLATEGDARDQAVELVRSLLVETPLDVEVKTVTASVRLSDGATIYVARCDFKEFWTRDRMTALDQSGR